MCDLEIGRKCSVQRNVNDKIKKSGRTGSIVLRIALFCCAMSSKKASQLSFKYFFNCIFWCYFIIIVHMIFHFIIYIIFTEKTAAKFRLDTVFVPCF